MMGDFADAFNEIVRDRDKLLLLPVYDAGGTADRSVSSGDLMDMLNPGVAIQVPTRDAAYNWIVQRANNFAAFAVCGARDPELPALAAKIAKNI